MGSTPQPREVDLDDAPLVPRVVWGPDNARVGFYPAAPRLFDHLTTLTVQRVARDAHRARTTHPLEASTAAKTGSSTISATVSTSGAAPRRGCPQRARSMFRTVSEIRAGNGRSFIAENTSASSNEGHARSERRREALVANAKDFSDFWGRPVACSRGASRGVYLVPFFPSGVPRKPC